MGDERAVLTVWPTHLVKAPQKVRKGCAAASVSTAHVCDVSTRHASNCYAHAVRNGAILVVNPLAVHGTAEFDYLPGDDMRIMVAFFVKSSVVKGMATGASHGRACGLAVPPACKPTHRGKGQ